MIGAVMLFSTVSCEKNAEYNQTLGLMSKYNVLSAEGGNTQVGVFSNTSWTVEMDRVVDWASIDRFSGYKTGHIEFDFEKNYGRARRVILVFKAGDETRTLNMYQSARIEDKDCKLELGGESTRILEADAQTVEIPFSTNLIYLLDEMYLTLQYAPGEEPLEPWITLKSVTNDVVSIEIASNEGDASRTTYLQISHMDAGSYDSEDGDGDVVSSNTITVIQKKKN